MSYLDALDHIHKLNSGTVPTVLLVLFFCVMQLLLLELPLPHYAIVPDRTQQLVNAFKAWLGRSGPTAAEVGAAVIGAWLMIRGVVTLL